jgi:hypothetical protein
VDPTGEGRNLERFEAELFIHDFFFYRYPVFWQHALAVVADVIHQWCIFNVYDFLLGISAAIVHKDCLSQ